MPAASHVRVPEFSCSWLRLLEGSSDDSDHWVPAAHLGAGGRVASSQLPPTFRGTGGINQWLGALCLCFWNYFQTTVTLISGHSYAWKPSQVLGVWDKALKSPTCLSQSDLFTLLCGGTIDSIMNFSEFLEYTLLHLNYVIMSVSSFSNQLSVQAFEPTLSTVLGKHISPGHTRSSLDMLSLHSN